MDVWLVFVCFEGRYNERIIISNVASVEQRAKLELGALVPPSLRVWASFGTGVCGDVGR